MKDWGKEKNPNKSSQESTKSCWILTDGSIGMINQGLGVAESLGFSVDQKVIRLRAPWCWLTPYIRWGDRFAISSTSDQIDFPFPDVVISCGRQAIIPALYIRRVTRGRTKVIHVQNPVINPKHFDAVLAPQHDSISGSNVIETIGAPHRVTMKRLAQEKNLWENPPQQRMIGVLLGGPSGAYPMDQESIETILASLKEFASKGYKLLISPSRRTPLSMIEQMQKNLVQGKEEQVYLWDGQGDNPYFSILAHSDALFVTCDSVCMITEACATDKPVYLFPLKGGTARFNKFHESLISLGRVKWWGNEQSGVVSKEVNFTRVTPLDEADNIMARLRELLGNF